MNAWLVLYVFFDEDIATEVDVWGTELHERLNRELNGSVTLCLDDQPIKDEHKLSQSRVHIYTQVDSRVVYIFLKESGTEWKSIWQNLNKKLLKGQSFSQFFEDSFKEKASQALIRKRFEPAFEKLKQEFPNRVEAELKKEAQNEAKRNIQLITSTTTISRVLWGVSVFFGAEIISPLSEAAKKDLFKEIPFPIQSNERLPAICSVQTWGELWQLTQRQGEGWDYPQVYTVLYKQSQSSLLKNILFSVDGMDCVDLWLHKAYQQIAGYEKNKGIWRNQSNILNNALLNIINNMSNTNRPIEPTDIPNLLNQYVQLVRWTTQVQDIQTTININTENYERFVKEKGLISDPNNDNVFCTHLKRLHQKTTQLTKDTLYLENDNERLDTHLQAIQVASGLLVGQRESRRESILVWIGIILGSLQAWPIIQGIIKNEETYWLDGIFLVVIILSIVFLAMRWFKQR